MEILRKRGEAIEELLIGVLLSTNAILYFLLFIFTPINEFPILQKAIGVISESSGVFTATVRFRILDANFSATNSL